MAARSQGLTNKNIEEERETRGIPVGLRIGLADDFHRRVLRKLRPCREFPGKLRRMCAENSSFDVNEAAATRAEFLPRRYSCVLVSEIRPEGVHTRNRAEFPSGWVSTFQ